MNRTNNISVKKLIFFLFFAFISFGLKAQKKVVGNYGSTAAEECTYFFRYFFYDDSTFFSISVMGAIGQGKYNIFNDSIYMYYEKVEPVADKIKVNPSLKNNHTLKMYNEILASTPKYSGLNLFAIVNGEKYKFEISGSCEIDSIKNLFNNDSINISIIQEIKSWTDPETHTVRDTFISNKIFSKSICSNNLKDGYKEILISPAWNSYFPWNLFCCTVPKGVIEKAMLIRNSGSDWTLKGQRIGFLRCPN